MGSSIKCRRYLELGHPRQKPGDEAGIGCGSTGALDFAHSCGGGS